jgi:hypothetical protein
MESLHAKDFSAHWDHEPRGRSAGFQTGYAGRLLPKAGLDAGAPTDRFMESCKILESRFVAMNQRWGEASAEP